MRERPILFSGEMVRAILDGRKIQTRRVITPQPDFSKYSAIESVFVDDPRHTVRWYEMMEIEKFAASVRGDKKLLKEKLRVARCPYGAEGDHLWVREKFKIGPGRSAVYFDTLNRQTDSARWKPSIHMPRKFSRITLQITDIRVEQLQDIKPDDVEAEGFFKDALNIERFMALWDSLNVKRGYGWEVNPYVWAITFRRI